MVDINSYVIVRFLGKRGNLITCFCHSHSPYMSFPRKWESIFPLFFKNMNLTYCALQLFFKKRRIFLNLCCINIKVQKNCKRLVFLLFDGDLISKYVFLKCGKEPFPDTYITFQISELDSVRSILGLRPCIICLFPLFLSF